MQGSLEDIYNKLSDSAKKDVYYYDTNEIISDYEILTFSTIIGVNDNDNDNDIVKMELLNESQLITSDKNIKDNVIVFTANHYLDKIAKSFKYNINRIECQFDMDFNRSELYFNNHRLTKKEIFIDKINKFKKTNIEINNNTFSLDKVILMLCNQSSLAYSFLLMCKMYNNDIDGIYVTSNKCRYYLSENNEKNFSMELNALFNLKNINENKNISEINIITNIDVIFKNNKYELCKLGIIYWNSQDIR